MLPIAHLCVMADLWTVFPAHCGNWPGFRAERNLRVVPRVPVDKMPLPLPNCPKCGGQTKVIGQSEHPVLTYLRCDGCGHVFVPSVSRS